MDSAGGHQSILWCSVCGSISDDGIPYKPTGYTEVYDLLRLIHRRQGITGPQLQQVERILRAVGDPMRRA